MNRTEVATRATTALRNLEGMFDDIERVTKDGATVAAGPALAAAADHLAVIFDYPGDDNVRDAVAKAVDKLTYVAHYIRDLANAKPEVDRTEMLDPALEYLRLLRDAEDRLAKSTSPDRINTLLNIADRYLSDALHTAYKRRKEAKETPDAITPAADPADVTSHAPADSSGPRHKWVLTASQSDALNDLFQVASPGSAIEDISVRVSRRLRHAAMLEAANVPDELVIVMCNIAGAGNVTQNDINSLNLALRPTPTKDA